MNKAPNFTLKDTENDDVTLSDLKSNKKIVLLFFPLAFSGVCTKELCLTRDNMKIYESLDAEVIAISVDSFFTLKAFKEANNLNFRLLSDFNKEVSRMFGVLNEDFFGMKGVSNRAAFVIDKEGSIVYEEIVEDSGKLPQFDKVQAALTSLG